MVKRSRSGGATSSPGAARVQVAHSHYLDPGYDDELRFLSYQKQITLARALGPRRLLEVGVGNATVSESLRRSGIEIATIDIDVALRPGVVGDIRALPVSDASVDLAMACEVLEHLPFDDLTAAVAELRRVSRRYVLVSVPYCAAPFELVLRLPALQRLFGRTHLRLSAPVPKRLRTHRFDGEHYWEAGTRQTSLRQVRSALRAAGLRIVDESTPLLALNHRFFVLERRGAER